MSSQAPRLLPLLECGEHVLWLSVFEAEELAGQLLQTELSRGSALHALLERLKRLRLVLALLKRRVRSRVLRQRSAVVLVGLREGPASPADASLRLALDGEVVVEDVGVGVFLVPVVAAVLARC